MADREVTLQATLRDGVSSPLAKIGTAFAGLGTNITQISARLAPLTGRVGAFVTGLFSVRAAQAAIAAAKDAVTAEAQLLSALKGRRDLLQQIQVITSRLQDTTTFDGDQLNQIAALFLNAGVAVKDLNGLLQLTTDISAGTGKSLETIARGLALLNQGESAGSIARIVPEIRDLLQESEGGAKAVELLRVRFKGAAAAIAATDFGKAAQETNKLEDQQERLGNQLVKIKVAILQGAVPALSKLADALETPEGQAFLGLLTQIVSKVTEFVPQIVSLILAAQAFSFLKWLAPFLVFAAKLAPIAGVLVLIVSLLEAAGVNLADVGNIVGSVLKFVVDLGKAFLNGASTAEDLFDVVQTRAKQAGVALYALFINPVIAGFKALLAFGGGVGDEIAGVFTLAAGKVAKGFGNAFEFVIKGVAKGLDAITNKAADLIEKLPGVGKEVADKLRTNLESAVPKFDFGGSAIAAGNRLLADGATLLQNAVPNAVKDITEETDRAGKRIAELQDELDKRLEERSKKRLADSQVVSNEQAKIEIATRERTLVDIAKLESDTQKQINENTTDLRERRAKRELTVLRDQLDAEKITFEQFIAAQEELELQPINAVIAARQLVITSLEDEKAKLVANKGEVADILALTRQILELTEKQALSIEDQKDKEAELQKEREANARKREQETSKEISSLIDSAISARDIFDRRIEAIRGKVKDGFLFSSEGAEQEKRALDDFNSRLDTFSGRIEDLLDKNPELQKQFADVGLQLEVLSIQTQQVDQDFADLARGFEAGARNYIQNASDMREAGLKLGETTVSSIGQGFTDAIFEADFTFQEFAANFLKQIAKMIVQLLLFRALSSFLGIGIGGANSGGLILGFNDGGRVPGPLVGRDMVDAKLTPGEYVHNTDAVDYYGVAAMQAINRRLIPRGMLSASVHPSGFSAKSNFADGGRVLSGGNGGGATLVADAQTMERLLAGGSTALVRWMRENADTVRSSIGGAK